MRKVIIFIVITLILILSRNAYCTMPWPPPERKEDIVEKFKLYDVDKIIIKAKFSENYFRTIHNEFDYLKEITNADDIRTLLKGFSNCNANDRCLPEGRPKIGEIIFFSAGKKIISLELAFWYYDPLFIFGDTCYFLYGSDFHGRFDETFLKYLPLEFKKAKENMPHH